MSFMSAKYEITCPQFLAIIFFCFILFGLELFLLKQNQINQLTENRNESAVTVGTKILSLIGLVTTENKVEINSNAERKTLRSVFSAACRFFEKNALNWKEILNPIPSEKINNVGSVSLGENGEKFLNKFLQCALRGFYRRVGTINLYGKDKSKN